MSKSKKPFRYLEHTADVGIEFWGDSMEESLSALGQAFTNLLTDISQVRASEEYVFKLPEGDPKFSMIHFLEELLFRFETKGELYSDFEIQRSPDRSLKVIARGEAFDGKKHDRGHEIKAVTYHQAELDMKGETWIGKIILDI